MKRFSKSVENRAGCSKTVVVVAMWVLKCCGEVIEEKSEKRTTDNQRTRNLVAEERKRMTVTPFIPMKTEIIFLKKKRVKWFAKWSKEVSPNAPKHVVKRPCG